MAPKIALLVDLAGPLVGALRRLEELDMQGRIELKPLTSVGSQLSPKFLADCDGCITRPSAPHLVPELLPVGKPKFVVATLSVGRAHLAAIEDCPGVKIVSVRGTNSAGTAELTVLLAQLLARPVHQGVAGMERGVFDRAAFDRSRRLSGMSWLAIGGGNVVRSVVSKLASHDLSEITVWNRTASHDKLDFLTGEVPLACLGARDELESGLSTTIEMRRDHSLRFTLRRRELGRDVVRADVEVADIVSLHVELTEQTRGLVDAGFLGCLKPGALLVNMGRGELVDEQAVVTALAAGRLAGYGADVVAEAAENDRDPRHSPLWQYAIEQARAGRKNILLTPHVGGHVAPDLMDTANGAIDGLLQELQVY